MPMVKSSDALSAEIQFQIGGACTMSVATHTPPAGAAPAHPDRHGHGIQLGIVHKKMSADAQQSMVFALYYIH